MIADDLNLKLNSEIREILFDTLWSYFNSESWFQLKAGLEIPLYEMFDRHLHEKVKKGIEE